MSLSSLLFLFGFLPVFLLIWFICRKEFRSYVLFIFSLCFYFLADTDFGFMPRRMLYILFLVFINYAVSLLISYFRNKKQGLARLFLASGICFNVGILFFYKYSAFFVNNINAVFHSAFPVPNKIALPGISFIVFSLISYLVDVYKNLFQVEKNIVKFSDYVLMFPKVIMGPIVRYKDIKSGFDFDSVSKDSVNEGARRFILGFCKKIIIADNLAVLINSVNVSFRNSEATVFALWLGSLAFSLRLFFDFSGYSDMAVGIGKILGFNFKENFNYPYCCKSVSDFWKRWHISLSEWFRDYLYISLGGSRKSALRNVFNLAIVWLCTGIWHGAGFSFIAWGLVFFVLILFERYLVKPSRRGRAGALLWRIFVLLMINFNWVLFSHNGLKEGINYCLAMTGFKFSNSGFSFAGNAFFNLSDVRFLREYGIYVVLGILFSTPVVRNLKEKFSLQKDSSGVLLSVKYRTVLDIAECILYVCAFLFALSFIVISNHNPFMYQQF
ncbi:MAG: MBOAT family O-acyltransferase [Treponema sp.]